MQERVAVCPGEVEANPSRPSEAGQAFGARNSTLAATDVSSRY